MSKTLFPFTGTKVGPWQGRKNTQGNPVVQKWTKICARFLYWNQFCLGLFRESLIKESLQCDHSKYHTLCRTKYLLNINAAQHNNKMLPTMLHVCWCCYIGSGFSSNYCASDFIVISLGTVVILSTETIGSSCQWWKKLIPSKLQC